MYGKRFVFVYLCRIHIDIPETTHVLRKIYICNYYDDDTCTKLTALIIFL